MSKILTKNAAGEYNGWLLPIWHCDSNIDIDQIYLTVVSVGETKGPHLHLRRCGRFVCIRGNVKITTRDEAGMYYEQFSGDAHGYEQIYVEPGTPAAIQNVGDGDAYVLNMPTPPWRESDPDDWPVENWK